MRRAKDLDQITNEREAQKQKYDGLRKQRLDEFMAGFSLISLKLKEMYQVRAHIFCFREKEISLTSCPCEDDHSWRECGARIGRQHGSVLRGYYFQCHATQEELEKHIQSIRR